jgi:dihydroorotate dehydrogenase
MLLSLPAETAHLAAISAMKLAEASLPGRLVLGCHAPDEGMGLEQSVFGLDFSNPVGLAAGFDKDGEAISAAARLGFGWIEIGTVTPRPQAGNPRPRLFRYKDALSLENRMGFNNAGGGKLLERLRKSYPAPVPLGVNLGKNKDTPNADALGDYATLLELLEGHCDYFVVNVSSPNTPGLRDLQDEVFLSEVLEVASELTERPVFIKLSPDLEIREIINLVNAAVEDGATGAILTNTTNQYSLLPEARGVGGLSGHVLKEKSFEVLEAVAEELFGRCALVSVGGIDSGEEVYRRLRAGASLVQLYTALVYGGPQILSTINEELSMLLARDGFGSVSEAVGVDRR